MWTLFSISLSLSLNLNPYHNSSLIMIMLASTYNISTTHILKSMKIASVFLLWVKNCLEGLWEGPSLLPRALDI